MFLRASSSNGSFDRRTINDCRYPIVGADGQKLRPELFAGANIHWNNRIGQPQLLQHDRDFPAVRRRRVMEVDHAVVLKMAAAS
jgi:hypothetical protein